MPVHTVFGFSYPLDVGQPDPHTAAMLLQLGPILVADGPESAPEVIPGSPAAVQRAAEGASLDIPGRRRLLQAPAGSAAAEAPARTAAMQAPAGAAQAKLPTGPVQATKPPGSAAPAAPQQSLLPPIGPSEVVQVEVLITTTAWQATTLERLLQYAINDNVLLANLLDAGMRLTCTALSASLPFDEQC